MMKGVAPLFLGIFGTFAFSWVGLALIPSIQIGHLDPQMDEEGNDAYPAPQSGLAERGRRVYVANGCVYCHSQQVRADYAAADIARKWGERRSAPRDYIFDHPVLLGKMRMGPDLANIGKRAPSDDTNAPAPASTNAAAGAPAPAPPAGNPPTPGAAPANAPAAPAQQQPPAGSPSAPGAQPPQPAPPGGSPAAAPPPGAATAPSPAAAVAAPTADAPASPTTTTGPNNEPLQYSAAWHHRHLYHPRSVTPWSTMPAFRFLYEKRRITGEPSADALKLGGPDAAPDGWEVVPTYDARALVAYLMSLDQSHELKEVKSATPPSPAAPGKAVK